MSKHRPSASNSRVLPRPAVLSAGRRELSYWRKRVFRNTYTRNGKRFLVRGWSVKIQHRGKRVTHSLRSAGRAQAALEAQRLYQSIVVRGGNAVGSQQLETGPRTFAGEMTVVIRWADDPVAWTYTTLGAQPGAPSPVPLAQSSKGGGLINVAIVETAPQIRRALADLVSRQKGFTCGLMSASPEEAHREIPRRSIQLVLINQKLAVLSRLGFQQELRRLTRRPACFVYGVYQEEYEILGSAPSGALGYFLKRTPPHRLFDPIVGGVAKVDWFQDALAQRAKRYFQTLLDSWPPGGVVPDLARLTRREKEVLALMSQGCLDKGIAASLRISIWTVHGHVKSIYEKLGVHNRTEAVLKYLQR